MKSRQFEHQDCLRTGLLDKSAVYEHQHNIGHQTLFDNTFILAKSPYFINRQIRESIKIL